MFSTLALAIMFSNSRTFPGHAYSHNNSTADAFQFTRIALQSLCRARQEIIDQFRNIFRPIAQRRHGKRNDSQSIIQVFAKTAGGNFLLQIAIARGQHAHVNIYGIAGADALERFFLQHAQQFRLQRQIDLADFVEQNRAAIGQFKAAGPRAVGPGERAAFVAEQFAFHQLGRQDRAIQADQRSVCSIAGRVQSAGDQFLARAAFADDEYGFRRPRHLGNARGEATSSPH